MISELSVKKKPEKKERKPSQVVVVNPAQPAQKQNNPDLDSLKQNC